MYQQNKIIGIVGMGYVGLPLALRFAEVGFKVIGFDIDQSKVDAIHAGQIVRGCPFYTWKLMSN